MNVLSQLCLQRSWLYFACAGLVVCMGCYSADGEQRVASKTTEKKLTGRQVLDHMFDQYRQADSYTDMGEFHERAIVAGSEETSDPISFAVTFVRPNRLRLQMFGATLVSNGEKVRAAIPGLNRQVLEIDAPQVITLPHFTGDQVLHEALTANNPLFTSPQMDLLLADRPQHRALTGADEPLLLDEGQIDGHGCYRVVVRGADGKWVYWVDKKTFVLRRLELPTRGLLEEVQQTFALSGQPMDLTDLSVWFSFKGAQFGQNIATEAFEMEIPEDAVRLKQFVTPVPEPRPPRIGEAVGAFVWHDLDGKQIDRESLQGKVVVLDFWTMGCQFCNIAMPALEKVHKKYKEDDRVNFLAVNADGLQVSNRELEEKIRSWGCTAPVVRDPEMEGVRLLEIDGFPTTVLLGPTGKIHVFHVGFHPDYNNYQGLDEAIDYLLRGEDVAQQMIDQHQNAVRQFKTRLVAAQVDEDASLQQNFVDISPSKIATASKPKKIRLEKIWENQEVQTPGNILVISPSEADSEIFVLDGWRSVAQVDSTGTTLARHDLPLPEGAGISFLRTALDGEGHRRFIAAGVAQQQLHCFDEDWNLLWSYPEGEHAGIADVRFADLQGDNFPELLVSYWGMVGVQSVSLEGKRVWKNRSLEDVMQLAVTDPDASGQRKVLAANKRGTLVPLNHQGKHDPDVRVPGRAIVHLTASDLDGDGQTEMCALALLGMEKQVALGLDVQGRELWSYELPEGLHRHLVERVAPVHSTVGLDGWLLPAADGSIHWIGTDGKLIDQFNYGAVLTGLAVVKMDGETVLMVSSVEGLTAWKVVTGEDPSEVLPSEAETAAKDGKAQG